MNKPFVAPQRADILYLCQLRCRQHKNNIRIAYKYFIKLILFIFIAGFLAWLSFKYQQHLIAYGILATLFIFPPLTGLFSKYRYLHNHQELYADFFELKEKIKKDKKSDEHPEVYYQELQQILNKPIVYYKGRMLPT